MLRKMVFSFLAVSALSAVPQAVVFDWGRVMANPDKKWANDFLCRTLNLTQEEFERANAECREMPIASLDIAEKRTSFDILVKFWSEVAKAKKIDLSSDWPHTYRTTICECLHVNPQMYALVEELKTKGVPVALLSNIRERHAWILRDCGFYDPFDPCILSCEIGLEKPDLKAYDALLNALNLPGKEVVFFDDKLINIEAARQRGIDAIQFESAEQVRKELTARGLL